MAALRQRCVVSTTRAAVGSTAKSRPSQCARDLRGANHHRRADHRPSPSDLGAELRQAGTGRRVHIATGARS